MNRRKFWLYIVTNFTKGKGGAVIKDEKQYSWVAESKADSGSNTISYLA